MLLFDTHSLVLRSAGIDTDDKTRDLTCYVRCQFDDNYDSIVTAPARRRSLDSQETLGLQVYLLFVSSFRARPISCCGAPAALFV